MHHRYLGIPVFLGLVGWASALFADTGHCTYRQLAPKINRLYSVCHAPATPKTCEELVSRYRSRVEYGDGACPVGALGACDIGGSRVYFYAGDANELAKGCSFLEGTWLAKAQPPTSSR